MELGGELRRVRVARASGPACGISISYRNEFSYPLLHYSTTSRILPKKARRREATAGVNFRSW